MLPRWHIILGGIFTVLIWLFAPSINPVYLGLIFASSFLIDFDHYLVAAFKQKKIRLKHAFEYHDKMAKKEIADHKKGIRERGDFHIFHTVEVHALVAILGIFWTPFFYVFIGMTFHSLLDLVDIIKRDRFYRREYFLTNWLRNSF